MEESSVQMETFCTETAAAKELTRLRAECDELHAKLAVAVGLIDGTREMLDGSAWPSPDPRWGVLSKQLAAVSATLPDRAKALMEVVRTAQSLCDEAIEFGMEEFGAMVAKPKTPETGLCWDVYPWRLRNALARLKEPKNG